MNEEKRLRIDILPNQFLKDDETFDKDKALKLSGQIAGVCYDKEGFNHLKDEDEEKTWRRVRMTKDNGHHSVYDHIRINFNLQNVPKILAMVLNNEHDYTTSEKSARYTPVVRDANSPITWEEEELYNKWIDLFFIKIKDKYGDIYNDAKIKKLAQENARYLVTVFMPTQMIYTTSLRQINYLASFMDEKALFNEYDSDKTRELKKELKGYMDDFVSELERLNVLDDGLMKNEKNRSFSLFGHDLDKKEEYFGDVYSTNYFGSLAEIAQAERHRTLDYQMELTGDAKYFIPPIIEDDETLVAEWIYDMEKIGKMGIHPQGELVKINEVGKYDDFILKCKERLCSAAQLEIMRQTKDTLTKYKQALEEKNHPLAEDIEKYGHGARCTFPDYTCNSDCHFKEGKTLVRKI